MPRTVAEIDGDSSGLKTALGGAKSETKGLGDQFNDLKSTVGGAVVGMLAFEKIMQGVKAATDFLKSSVDAYTATNATSQAQIAGTSQRFTSLKESIGQAIVGGDNLSIMLGGVNELLGVLKTEVDADSGAIQSFTKSALAGALTGFAYMIKAGGYLTTTFDFMKRTVETLALGFKGFGAAVIYAGSWVAKVAVLVGDQLGGALLTAGDAVSEIALAIGELTSNNDLVAWAEESIVAANDQREALGSYVKTTEEWNRAAENLLVDTGEEIAAVWDNFGDQAVHNLEVTDRLGDSVLAIAAGIKDASSAASVLAVETAKVTPPGGGSLGGGVQSEASDAEAERRRRENLINGMREIEERNRAFQARAEADARDHAGKMLAIEEARKQGILDAQAAELAATEDAAARREQIYNKFIATQIRAVAQSAAAGKKMGEIAQQVVATTLSALGEEFTIYAGKSLLQGNVAAAAGWSALAGAAFYASAKLSPSGSAGGGSTPAAASASAGAATQTYNQTYVLNVNDSFMDAETVLRRFSSLQNSAARRGLLIPVGA